MTNTPPVLEYHLPEADQFSLSHVTADRDQHRSRVAALRADNDADEMAVRTMEETVDGTVAYLIYTNEAPDEALPEFDAENELVQWLRERFEQDDLQIVLAVYRAYRGIIEEKAEAGNELQLYKQMRLERIPDIVDHVQWRQSVPDVAAELLSEFIRVHLMPNTNHRTGISLLDRYLTSIDETFTMPDTGEEGEWYPWVVEFIHDSKRLLTLRRKLAVFRCAADVGFRTVRRKEGISIDVTTVDLERENAFEYYSERHLERSREFVANLLEQADATALQDERDDGKQAFVDRLRADQ